MIWPTQQAEKEPSEFRGHRVPGEFRGQTSGDTMDRVPGTPQSSGDTTEFRGHHTEFRGHHRVPGTQSSGDTEFRGHHTQLREFRDRRFPGTPQSSGGRVRGDEFRGPRIPGTPPDTEFRGNGVLEFPGTRSSGEFRGHHTQLRRGHGIPGTPRSSGRSSGDTILNYGRGRSSGDTILNYVPEFRGHHTTGVPGTPYSITEGWRASRSASEE